MNHTTTKHRKKLTINLEGKQIGRLKVLKWHGIGGPKRNTEWLCACTCGEIGVKTRSFLTSTSNEKKNCGNCVDGKTIIGNTFGTFKILCLKEGNRTDIAKGFYVGQCIDCGREKLLSKWMVRNAHKKKRKRNLTCHNCLIKSRQGGGLKIGDENKFLRIVESLGARGRGAQRKFYWKVECLFKGPKCKNFMEYSSTKFRVNMSCGCERRHRLLKVHGLTSRTHPHHKIYELHKHINNRCHKEAHENYLNYGGRGIYVCDEWRQIPGEKGRRNFFSFYNWCLTNGWEEGLQLDRIDNGGPYAPWNCQFIPAIENLFYSSIDNANEATLKTYKRYYDVWVSSLNLLNQKKELIEKGFLDMISRWKSRLLSRAKALNIELKIESELFVNEID